MTLSAFGCDVRVIYRVVTGVFRENLVHISRVLYITIPCVSVIELHGVLKVGGLTEAS